MYLALPAKVSQQVLMQVSHDWKLWQEASSQYIINPTKFKARPRIPCYKDKLYGRNLLVYTTSYKSQTIKKGYINFSKTKLKVTTKKG